MKIIILDLDDTIYDYIKFVKEGLKNVANFVHKKTKISKNKIYNDLIEIYYNKSTTKLFNYLEKKYQTKINVYRCILIYRYSTRNIKPYSDAFFFLKKYKKEIYLVTDGNKLVQKSKIKFLKIGKFFKRIYKTNQYGLKYNKPSLYCFDLIRKKEKCSYKNLIYIGDNPNKDFLNLNKVKSTTIRIKRGIFKNKKVKKLHDAKFVCDNFYKIDKVISQI